MVTYFTEKDLVAFGEYLLSAERTELIMGHEEFKGREIEALSSVYHADLANWINKGIEKE